MTTFLDGKPAEAFRRRLFYRLLRSHRHWHNRQFTASQSMETTAEGRIRVRWPGHGELIARPLTELSPTGSICSILASGPSVARLEAIERLFTRPTACVNGSVAIAQRVGVRIPYYFVSDSNFIEEQAALFKMGVGLADAVILNPMALFAAMQTTPGLLAGAQVFLHEDLRRPFKRARPSLAQMQRDPGLLVHPTRQMAFSLRPEIGTWPSGTVVYDAIQVLFGVGYRELLMFGVDLNSQGRCYHEEKASPSHLDEAYATLILPGFELVAAYCRLTGKKLVNCSIGSRLPDSVIPKQDGADVLAQLAAGPSRPMPRVA